jgi:trans-aconitate methyltransferase
MALRWGDHPQVSMAAVDSICDRVKNTALSPANKALVDKKGADFFLLY